jgi:hypothetical protein
MEIIERVEPQEGQGILVICLIKQPCIGLFSERSLFILKYSQINPAILATIKRP